MGRQRGRSHGVPEGRAETVRGRKKRQVAFDGQPNLFIAFANVDDAHEPLVATEDMAGVDSSMHTSEQEGK